MLVASYNMDMINSPETPKISCTYHVGWKKKLFQCPVEQICCGPTCCYNETLYALVICLGIAVLVIVPVIIVLKYIHGRKRKRDIYAEEQQRLCDMNAADQGPKESVVSLQEDDVGKSSCQSVKAAVLIHTSAVPATKQQNRDEPSGFNPISEAD